MLPVRRLGSNVVHYADVAPEWSMVPPPVQTACGVLLRGEVIVMRTYRACPRCVRLTGEMAGVSQADLEGKSAL